MINTYINKQSIIRSLYRCKKKWVENRHSQWRSTLPVAILFFGDIGTRPFFGNNFFWILLWNRLQFAGGSKSLYVNRLQFAGGSKSLYVISTSICWLNQQIFFLQQIPKKAIIKSKSRGRKKKGQVPPTSAKKFLRYLCYASEDCVTHPKCQKYLCSLDTNS